MIFAAVVVVVVIVIVVIVVVVVIVVIIVVTMMEDYGLEVLAKTSSLYQVPKLRNLNLNFLRKLWRDGRMEGQNDLYYPLKHAINRLK